MIYGIYCETPMGTITLTEEDCALTGLHFGKQSLAEERETPLLEEARIQLSQYFQGQRRVFDLPLQLKGTPFQRAVWQALVEIPYGETRSYGEIATAIGRPKATRAVGMANHVNPLAIVVPCHRVIGKNGSLTGYAGGLDFKRYLLNLEAAHRGC